MNKIMKEQEIIYLAVDSLKKRFPEIQVHVDKNHIDFAYSTKNKNYRTFEQRNLKKRLFQVGTGNAVAIFN